MASRRAARRLHAQLWAAIELAGICGLLLAPLLMGCGYVEAHDPSGGYVREWTVFKDVSVGRFKATMSPTTRTIDLEKAGANTSVEAMRAFGEGLGAGLGKTIKP